MTTSESTETGPLNGKRQRRRRQRWRIKPMSKLVWLWLLVPLALIYPIYLAGCALLGVKTVETDAEPLVLGTSGLPDDVWGAVLDTYLAGGRVDYGALAAAPADLERYVATLATTGPETDPERFASRDERLAYYINAYNALTLFGVVTHWPIDSVRDVRGPFEPKAGMGFFWGLRFRLDGDRINLYDLENDVIRRFGDARIHAAINCASAGCPTLGSVPYEAETLQAQLDEAASAFASEAPHVVVDAEARQIALSSIYDWFAEDFRVQAQQLGYGDTVLDWIEHYARPQVREHLQRAQREGYAVVFVDYDWRLNGF